MSTGSGNNFEVRLNTALKSFHSSLFDRSGQLKPEFSEFTDCPVCHSRDSAEIFIKDNFHYHRCLKCSMVYMNPRLNDEATKSFYNSDVNRVYNEGKFDAVSATTDLDDERNTENVRILKEFIAENKISANKLLEIGCAKGVFLKAAQNSGFEVHGLELNRENSEYASKLVGGNVHAQDLFTMNYPTGSFDIVYTRDVIEHIHNPGPFLGEVGRILKPGGVLFFETHNIDGWVYKIVGSKHTVIFGFEHPVHWSPATLSLALNQHGIITREVKFNSTDFTIRSIARYFLRPSYTTVFPSRNNNKILQFVLKVIFAAFSRFPFRQIDEFFMPKLANAAGAGSTMKLLAMKN